VTGRKLSDGRKANGKWVDRWKDPLTGKHRQVTFDLKRDRDVYKRERIRRQQLGGAASVVMLERDMLLAEYVEHWWERHALVELTAKTRDVYAHVWAKHLLSWVGQLGLREFTPEEAMRLKTNLTRAGVGDPTIVKALVVLQSVFTLALTERRIEENPIARVKKPAQIADRQVAPIPPLVVEELRALLTEIRDRTMVSVLAYAGLRPQELLALAVEDIAPRSLFVHAKNVDGEILPYTKTKRHRAVDLLAPLAQDLREYMLAAGVRAGRLFPRPDGSEWTESQYRSWRRHVYQRHAPVVGIAGGRPYDLRGSWVSLMVWEGRTMLEVATMAGHSVQTCERHYARMFEDFDPAKRTSAEAAIWAARDEQSRRTMAGGDDERHAGTRTGSRA